MCYNAHKVYSLFSLLARRSCGLLFFVLFPALSAPHKAQFRFFHAARYANTMVSKPLVTLPLIDCHLRFVRPCVGFRARSMGRKASFISAIVTIPRVRVLDNRKWFPALYAVSRIAFYRKNATTQRMRSTAVCPSSVSSFHIYAALRTMILCRV